jgi:hypothetical protein
VNRELEHDVVSRRERNILIDDNDVLRPHRSFIATQGTKPKKTRLSALEEEEADEIPSRKSISTVERWEFAEREAYEVLEKQPQKKGRRREALNMSPISSGRTTAASGSFSAKTKDPQSFRSSTPQSSTVHCSLVNAIAISDRTDFFRRFYNSSLTFLSRYL